MKNFTFCNPTKIVFGKGSLSKLDSLIPTDARVLLTYGGGSVKKHGIYDQVIAELGSRQVVPFGGIEPNPDCSTMDKAVELGRSESVTWVLAVGGGSVIDASKVIAAAIQTPGWTTWDMVRKGYFEDALPLGTVLTVPATGSEMNSGSVISNRATKEKFALYTRYPKFSILDPTFTYTLSEHQVACGIADTFMHTLEQYLTTPGQSGVMDRMAEGILLNVLDFAPLRMKGSNDYDVACEYMLSATIALNGFLGMGVDQDWMTHRIGHEITALTDTTHGASLMMILPSMLRIMREYKMGKVLQLGERVFGIRGTDKDDAYDATVIRIEDFIHRLGLHASLSEAGIPSSVAEEVAGRFERRGYSIGENGIATPSLIRAILEEASK